MFVNFCCVFYVFWGPGVAGECRGVAGGSGETSGAEIRLQRRNIRLWVDIDLGTISEARRPSFTAVSGDEFACRGRSVPAGAKILASL